MLTNESQPTSIHNYLKRECVNMVKRCLNKEFASDIFDNYFETIDHSMNTRNYKHCTRLPPVRLEVASRGFYCTGGTLAIAYQLILGKLILSIFLRKKILNSLNNIFLGFKF